MQTKDKGEEREGRGRHRVVAVWGVAIHAVGCVGRVWGQASRCASRLPHRASPRLGWPLPSVPRCPRVSRSASKSPVPGFRSVWLAVVGRVPYGFCCSTPNFGISEPMHRPCWSCLPLPRIYPRLGFSAIARFASVIHRLVLGFRFAAVRHNILAYGQRPAIKGFTPPPCHIHIISCK
jgi:hypothetical protein